MKLFLLLNAVALLSIACVGEDKYESEPQNDETKEEFTLFQLLGKDLEDDKVVEFKKSLGDFEFEEVGKYPHIMFYASGVEMVYEAKTNKVASIFLMGYGNKWYKIYEGSLPEGLKWDMNRTEVEKKIGKGEKRNTYGGSVVYMYKDKSFEVMYNTEEEDMDAKIKSILIQHYNE
ncbi:MAG: hypothetical protein WDZ35_10615 [Crocinitomicaceae bacterium]